MKQTKNLFEISKQFEDFCEAIDALEGGMESFVSEQNENLLDLFVDTKLEHARKVSSYLVVMDTLKLQAANLSERAELLKRRAKTTEKLLSAIKERLVMAIESYPDLPWKSEDGDKLRIQTNPKKLELKVTTDKRSYSNIVSSLDTSPYEQDLIPYLTENKFFTIDTDRVKKDLMAGKKLSFAELSESGKHLRIY